MKQFINAVGVYFSALVIMVALDYLWLGVIAGHYYQRSLEHLIFASPRLAAAAAVYLVMSLGLYYFILRRRLAPRCAMRDGIVYGFCLYATYEFTNAALIPGWPPEVIVIDIAWGMLLMALTAGSVAYLRNRLS